MGQKNHPLNLRRHCFGNIGKLPKTFDQNWYSDYFFSKLLQVELVTSTYFDNLFKLLKLPRARLNLQHFQKKSQFYIFFCYPKQSREYKSRILKVPTNLKTVSPLLTQRKPLHLQRNSKFLKTKTTHFFQNTLTSKLFWKTFNEKSHAKLKQHFKQKAAIFNFLDNFQNPQQVALKIYKVNLENNKDPKRDTFSRNLSFKELKQLVINLYIFQKSKNLFYTNGEFHLFCNKKVSTKKLLDSSNNLLTSHNFFEKSQLTTPYQNYYQNSLSKFFNHSIKMIPFKANQEWQNAGYLVDEIVYLLERRVPFRLLKKKFLEELLGNPYIKGLRITCSGRVGGKSKKAQRAKIESLKYGQTSLHIFSSKIDFAVRTAHTPLGSMGVKIWICYK